MGKHIHGQWYWEKNTRDMQRASERCMFARKDAAALGISDRTVRRILHEKLRFRPYKMAVMLQFTERDFNARQTARESLLEALSPDALVFFSEEAHFHISGCE